MSQRAPVLSRRRSGAIGLALSMIAACTGQIEGTGEGASGPTRTPGAAMPGAGASPTAGVAPPPGAPANPGVTAPPTTAPVGAMRPTPASCGFAPARIWKLTPEQYARTVAQLVPGAAVAAAELKKTSATVGMFGNDAGSVDLAQPQMELLLANAGELAKSAVAAGAKIAPCLATRPATAPCIRETVATFGERAFRRPLAPAEIERFVKFHDAQVQAAGADAGLQDLFRAFFLSPQFLYRTELGDPAVASGPVKLTAFERASALSYFITDGPPDAALLMSARTGALATTTQMEAQARRLLATAEGVRGIVGFLGEQLTIDAVRTVTKDAKLTQWTPELAADLATETRRFIEHVVFKDTGKLATLLTGKTSFLNDRLARLYGGAVTGTELRQATLPGARMGLLGQGSFLAAVALPNDTDIVRRGRFVRERLLCQSIAEPPANLADVAIPTKPDGVHTQRERMVVHSTDPVCAACHKAMDLLGFGLESFDTLGRHRTTDVAGKPVDDSGVITGVSGGDRPYRNFSELATLLSTVPETAACMTTQLFTYAHGRAPAAADGCALADVHAAFEASGGDLRELAVALVSSDQFVTRSR